MKKVAKSILTTTLLILASTALLAANDKAVIRITAYVPETATFRTHGNDFVVESNTQNFTYEVQETTKTKMLFVVAN